MSVELLQKLGQKVDNAIETIELLRLQVEELEEHKARLQQENTTLLNKQKAWEQNLTMMLDKLEGVEVSEQAQAPAHAQANNQVASQNAQKEAAAV